MKVLLAGAPGTGKSTVFRRTAEILRGLGREVVGIATPEVRGPSGSRTGFDVVDLTTSARATLSRVPAARGHGAGVGPMVGRYEVDVEEFESVALPALEAGKQGGIVAIDEVGKMEFFSTRFAGLWLELLESNVDLLAVVGRAHLGDCRGKGEVVEVTLENRNDLPDRVAELF